MRSFWYPAPKVTRSDGTQVEKLIYALWRRESQTREAFNAQLLEDWPDRVSPLAQGLRINLQDSSVAGGSSPRLVATDPQMEAVVQLWVDQASRSRCAAIESALSAVALKAEGWLVCEATPIANETCPPGTPTAGFSQIAFLQRPATLDHESWRDNWQNGHTEVAIRTQSTFEYVQNLVVRPVSEAAGPYAAIVEECFPTEAFTDVSVYFDAVGDQDALANHSQQMMESCARFMSMDGCDCIPTRQYEIKPLWQRGTP